MDPHDLSAVGVGARLASPLLPPSKFPSASGAGSDVRSGTASPGPQRDREAPATSLGHDITTSTPSALRNSNGDSAVFFAENDDQIPHTNAVTPSRPSPHRGDDDMGCHFVRPASAFERSPPSWGESGDLVSGGFGSPPFVATTPGSRRSRDRGRPQSAMGMGMRARPGSSMNMNMSITGAALQPRPNTSLAAPRPVTIASPARDRNCHYAGPLGSTNRHEYNPEAVEIKLSQERRRRQRAPQRSRTPRLEDTRLLTPTASSARKMRPEGTFNRSAGPQRTPGSGSILRKSMPPSTGRRELLNTTHGAIMGTSTARFVHDGLSKKQYTNVTLFEPARQYDVGKIIAEDFATPRSQQQMQMRTTRRPDPVLLMRAKEREARESAVIAAEMNPVVPDRSSAMYGGSQTQFPADSTRVWNPAVADRHRREMLSVARQERVRKADGFVGQIVSRNAEAAAIRDELHLKSHAKQAQDYQTSVEAMRKNLIK